MRAGTHHDIVKRVPFEVSSRDHGCCDQRADGATSPVNCMHESQQFTGLGQVSNPSVPRCITNSIAKPGESVSDHKQWIRRMLTNNQIRHGVAEPAEKSKPTLSDPLVERVVQCRGKDVAYEWRKKNQGYDKVR
jgi:hypothetical protein